MYALRRPRRRRHFQVVADVRQRQRDADRGYGVVKLMLLWLLCLVLLELLWWRLVALVLPETRRGTRGETKHSVIAGRMLQRRQRGFGVRGAADGGFPIPVVLFQRRFRVRPPGSAILQVRGGYPFGHRT